MNKPSRYRYLPKISSHVAMQMSDFSAKKEEEEVPKVVEEGEEDGDDGPAPVSEAHCEEYFKKYLKSKHSNILPEFE